MEQQHRTEFLIDLEVLVSQAENFDCGFYYLAEEDEDDEGIVVWVTGDLDRKTAPAEVEKSLRNLLARGTARAYTEQTDMFTTAIRRKRTWCGEVSVEVCEFQGRYDYDATVRLPELSTPEDARGAMVALKYLVANYAKIPPKKPAPRKEAV